MTTAKDRLSINDLAAAVVADDPVLQKTMRGLVRDMMTRMRYDMRYGNDALKSQYARAMAPYLLKAMQQVEADEASAKEREAYERMLADLRGDSVIVP